MAWQFGIATIVATIAVVTGAAAASNRLGEARSVVEQWVQTRQLITRTHADWRADKEMLEQTAQLFERELRAVDEQMSQLSTNSTQVARERAEAELLLATSNETLDRCRTFATAFEGRVRAVVPRLPEPLQEIVKPLLARLPADPGNTRMAVTERIQVLVGILNEVDKFNNAVNIFSEKRKDAQGAEVAVETVYVGLGAAYFVNEANDFAGLGAPGPDGWEWKVDPAIGSAVREVLRIYRNERGAWFIALPATIH